TDLRKRQDNAPEIHHVQRGRRAGPNRGAGTRACSGQRNDKSRKRRSLTMGLKELRAEIEDEVSTLLANDFAIEVTSTENVPHASDPAITFPDVTARSQGAKLIETCVLYIDIRRSTELNFSHKPKTVAKLYTAFVRAMTRVARYHDGHVR